MPATIARTGVQTYRRADGTEVREYRAPEQVFSAESLATLGGIPITIGHPGAVTPANYRQHAVGHVSDLPAQRKSDSGAEWVEAQLIVNDGETLARIDREQGDVTISMGYTADVLAQPGVTPSGERYDALQTNVRFNHLALWPVGGPRAGAGARLRLDAAGNEVQTFATGDRVEVVGKPHMPGADGPGTVELVDGNAYGIRFDKMPGQIHKWYVADELRPASGKGVKMDFKQDDASAKRLVKVDGIDVEFGSETHVSLLERQVAAEKTRADGAAATLATAQTKAGEVQAKLDAANKELDALKARDVNALVQDELDFRSKHLPILPAKYDFTGKSRDQVRADAVGAEIVAKVAALPEGERAGYMTYAIQSKLDAASKPVVPTHVPTVKVDGNAAATNRKDPRKAAYDASWSTK